MRSKTKASAIYEAAKHAVNHFETDRYICKAAHVTWGFEIAKNELELCIARCLDSAVLTLNKNT
jgi:hypothetical protein